MLTLDWQTCVQCKHWLICRWVLDAVEKAAQDGDDLARKQAGTSPPIRGFVPVCPVRDERRKA